MKCHLCDNHFEIETDPKVRIGILVEKSHLMLVFKKVHEILTFLNTYMVIFVMQSSLYTA